MAPRFGNLQHSVLCNFEDGRTSEGTRTFLVSRVLKSSLILLLLLHAISNGPSTANATNADASGEHTSFHDGIPPPEDNEAAKVRNATVVMSAVVGLYSKVLNGISEIARNSILEFNTPPTNADASGEHTSFHDGIPPPEDNGTTNAQKATQVFSDVTRLYTNVLNDISEIAHKYILEFNTPHIDVSSGASNTGDPEPYSLRASEKKLRDAESVMGDGVFVDALGKQRALDDVVSRLFPNLNRLKATPIESIRQKVPPVTRFTPRVVVSAKSFTLFDASLAEAIASALGKTGKTNKMTYGSTTAHVPLQGYKDAAFITDMKFGSNPQKLKVDSTTNLLWVPGEKCQPCKTNGYKSSVPLDSSVAEAKATFKVEMSHDVSDLVSGKFWKDTLNLGGAKIPDGAFITVTDATKIKSLYENVKYNGVMGLGTKNETTANGYDCSTPSTEVPQMQPLVSKLLESKHINRSIVAIEMPPIWRARPTAFGKRDGGSVSFGGAQPGKYDGQIIWVPTIPGKWASNLRRVMLFGNKTVTDIIFEGAHTILHPPPKVIWDTASSLIVGPKDDVAKIAHAVGAVEIENIPGQYAIKCRAVGSQAVGFDLRSGIFALKPEDYIVKVPGTPKESSDNCLLGFVGGSDTIVDWHFGELFMQKYYTVFDYARSMVGLAEQHAG